MNTSEKSHVDKQGTEFFLTTNSNEIYPSKAITRTIALSKSIRFYFEYLTDFFPIRVKRARVSLGKFIVFIVLERRLLVWRKALYLDSLNSNDLPLPPNPKTRNPH